MAGKRLLNEVSSGRNKLGIEIVKKLYILGKSQVWLAEQCECTRQYITEIIHGRSKPSADMAIKIAKALEMDVTDVRKLALERVA